MNVNIKNLEEDVITIKHREGEGCTVELNVNAPEDAIAMVVTALTAVTKVAFVDSEKDENAIRKSILHLILSTFYR